MTSIQVIRNPPKFPIFSCHLGHHHHKQSAQVVTQSYRRQCQSRAQAPHCIRSLIVEKLQLPNDSEHFRTTHKEVLRNLPENGHGNCLYVVVTMAPYHLESSDFQYPCDYHRQSRNHEPNSLSLQRGEPVFMAGVIPCCWDD
ncbi:hypothetical protein LINPERPRIM_LOCUS25982 [Linum perenne]